MSVSFPFVPASALEAVADAWASIDGKTSEFRNGRYADSIEAYGGHYAGYMSDAEELIERIEKRGYKIVRGGE